MRHAGLNRKLSDGLKPGDCDEVPGFAINAWVAAVSVQSFYRELSYYSPFRRIQGPCTCSAAASVGDELIPYRGLSRRSSLCAAQTWLSRGLLAFKLEMNKGEVSQMFTNAQML